MWNHWRTPSPFKEKLMLLFHIRHLDETSLANRIYLQQLKYGWTGPVKEGKEICQELGIPDVSVVQATKQEFKVMVKEACRLKDEKELKENILQKEKLQLLKEEDCKRKYYIEKMTLSLELFSYTVQIWQKMQEIIKDGENTMEKEQNVNFAWSLIAVSI